MVYFSFCGEVSLALWHGLPTVPPGLTEGLPDFKETCGRRKWHGRETVPQRGGPCARPQNRMVSPATIESALPVLRTTVSGTGPDGDWSGPLIELAKPWP